MMLTSFKRVALVVARRVVQGRFDVTASSMVPARSSSVFASVTPEHDLLDVLPHIKVEGLSAGEKVTLQLSVRDDEDAEFSSYAHYVASPGGTVSNVTDIALGGRFRGIFAAGLQTTLKTTPEVYKTKPILKYKRLDKTNIEVPLKYKLAVLPGHLKEEELYSERRPPTPIATTAFSRTFMGSGVRKIVLEGRSIYGTMFLPAGPGPHPPVLDMYGSYGGVIEQRSAMLASRGFASLILAYMNYKDLPARPTSLHLEYFEEAVDYIQGHEDCQKGAMGVIGSSRGSDMAILLASMSSNIKAVVTLNGANVALHITYCYKGKEVTPVVKFMSDWIVERSRGLLQINFPQSLLNPQNPDSLPIEKIPDDCEVLLITSDRDGLQGHRAGAALLDRAILHGKGNVSNLCLPAAGHVLEVPYLPHSPVLPMRMLGVHDHVKIPPTFWFGGESYGAGRAMETAWLFTLDLFTKKLIHEPKERNILGA